MGDALLHGTGDWYEDWYEWGQYDYHLGRCELCMLGLVGYRSVSVTGASVCDLLLSPAGTKVVLLSVCSVL